MAQSPCLIAASILAADPGHLSQAAKDAEAGGAAWLHLDVMDGHFVPNLTFGPQVVRALAQACTLFCDVHLMVQDPDAWLVPFADAGAHQLVVHAEAASHLHRTLTQIRGLGCKAGVSLNPATPVSAIVEVLHMVDVVLVMSVNPGFGGQSFITAVLGKVAALKALRAERGLHFLIEIDGGITAETIGAARRAGVDVCVAGTAIFGHSAIGQAIGGLLKAAAHPG